MQWTDLLNLERLKRPGYKEHPDRTIYVQDLDRIAFCAPFRRLANKTQVHPLYDNDHLHNRLIHSVETASVGRSLGMAVGRWLEERRAIEPGEKHVVSGLVQAACLAHDIGNPPFGHSGEAAIGQWFDEKFQGQDYLFRDIDDKLRTEFCNFEGNAQGFRILTRLEMYRNQGGMQLSHGVLGAFTKYPATAYVQSVEKSENCDLKKFGIFDSEEYLFEEVASSLGLPSEKSKNGRWWRRHPLVFLVEAADDICYNVMDVEDAYISDDLEFETVVTALRPLSGMENPQRKGQLQEEHVAELRARGISAAVKACVAAFDQNYDLIMKGEYSSSLLKNSQKAEQFDRMKELARNRIFTGRRKTELEVFGRNVIHRVLEGVLPVFQELRDLKWQKSDLGSYNEQVVRAINLDLRDVTDSYSALHAMTDYVSGMTDRYSVKVAEMLAGKK
ncbi:MAG: dNTP triphosphohydrolase [Candidatus Poribacteria bacterium]|nr:dNTP triphosphohydrolase [Candidatus Poribacteria bacterium]